MVGAINAPTSGANTFQNYQAAAQKLGANQAQDTHSGGLVGLGASATGTAGPIQSGGSNNGAANHLASSVLGLLVSLAVAISLL